LSNIAKVVARVLGTGYLPILIGLESALVAVLVGLPFGFDHRSSVGLDFNDLIVFIFTASVLFVIGMVVAIKQRRVLASLILIGLAALVVFRLVDEIAPQNPRVIEPGILVEPEYD